ncbi:hypothetical protein EV13_1504 [Prochlorococcus sp. MIT 0702]|uniref:hypothetical protein n=1 Tax=Prochlorococcus sp. MIT 0702 TaxID=1499503 RepID=UPI0005337D67|nr:hypothetical protein EV13_1504 [Prochlorococcus sp. MIT 0702]
MFSFGVEERSVLTSAYEGLFALFSLRAEFLHAPPFLGLCAQKGHGLRTSCAQAGGPTIEKPVGATGFEPAT